MKFPYGISDFQALITEGYLYIDRTDRIPRLEKWGKQLLFLRPRRFGKSLLLNMLANYYDLAKADQFEQLFGHLKIGQNPTAKHNQYFVMQWDFSQVQSQDSAQEIKRELYQYINNCIQDFQFRYEDYLKHDITLDDNAMISFNSLLSIVNLSGHPLYLLIDEYDNFSNEVMASQMNGKQRYLDLVYGEGLLKGVFKNIKAGAAGRGLDRAFITGVSPVVMADMSSGYNIVMNIYRLPEFNDLCGFHHNEVQQIVSQMADELNWEETQYQTALTVLKQFYNGYTFDEDQAENLVYNPTMTLYFLEYLHNYGKFPKNLLDHNLAMDRNRLSYIAQLPHGASVIENALDETNPITVPQIHDRFGIDDMLKHQQHEQELASLLYYLGILTLDGTTMYGKLKLRIPNLVIRRLYLEKLQTLLLPDLAYPDYHEAVTTFISTGNLQPLCELIETRFSVFSNRDYRWNAEMAVKAAFVMFLYDDQLYVLDSEPELQRRYADLVMILRPDKRQYQLLDFVMEFKFIALKELQLTAAQVREMAVDELQALELVTTAFNTAKTQLTAYRTRLEQRYGTALRLHALAVVAIGFERLVWVRG